MKRETFGVWRLINPERKDKIAISIQYEISDLGKMMPQFVDQLKVPLIAISDSRSLENIYFKDTSEFKHFSNLSISERGFMMGEEGNKMEAH